MLTPTAANILYDLPVLDEHKRSNTRRMFPTQVWNLRVLMRLPCLVLGQSIAVADNKPVIIKHNEINSKCLVVVANMFWCYLWQEKDLQLNDCGFTIDVLLNIWMTSYRRPLTMPLTCPRNELDASITIVLMKTQLWNYLWHLWDAINETDTNIMNIPCV